MVNNFICCAYCNDDAEWSLDDQVATAQVYVPFIVTLIKIDIPKRLCSFQRRQMPLQ